MTQAFFRREAAQLFVLERMDLLPTADVMPMKLRDFEVAFS
jgi:hypothetical protein